MKPQRYTPSPKRLQTARKSTSSTFPPPPNAIVVLAMSDLSNLVRRHQKNKNKSTDDSSNATTIKQEDFANLSEAETESVDSDPETKTESSTNNQSPTIEPGPSTSKQELLSTARNHSNGGKDMTKAFANFLKRHKEEDNTSRPMEKVESREEPTKPTEEETLVKTTTRPTATNVKDTLTKNTVVTNTSPLPIRTATIALTPPRPASTPNQSTTYISMSPPRPNRPISLIQSRALPQIPDQTPTIQNPTIHSVDITTDYPRHYTLTQNWTQIDFHRYLLDNNTYMDSMMVYLEREGTEYANGIPPQFTPLTESLTAFIRQHYDILQQHTESNVISTFFPMLISIRIAYRVFTPINTRFPNLRQLEITKVDGPVRITHKHFLHKLRVEGIYKERYLETDDYLENTLNGFNELTNLTLKNGFLKPSTMRQIERINPSELHLISYTASDIPEYETLLNQLTRLRTFSIISSKSLLFAFLVTETAARAQITKLLITFFPNTNQIHTAFYDHLKRCSQVQHLAINYRTSRGLEIILERAFQMPRLKKLTLSRERVNALSEMDEENLIRITQRFRHICARRNISFEAKRGPPRPRFEEFNDVNNDLNI